MYVIININMAQTNDGFTIDATQGSSTFQISDGGDVSGTNIEFVLTGLDASAQLGVSGELEAAVAAAIDASAVIDVTMSATAVQGVFYFKTDASSIDDVSATDLSYTTVSGGWADISYSEGTVYRSSLPIDSGDTLKEDFIRHLANELFNTHLGADLFSNEDALKDAISAQDSNVTTSIRALLVNGENLDNNTDTSANFSRVLLTQMTSSSVGRERLNNIIDLSSNAQDDVGEGWYYVPFEAGDIIAFPLTVHAAEGQENLTGVTSVDSRKYIVRITLT